jgi:hypothetical protein
VVKEAAMTSRLFPVLLLGSVLSATACREAGAIDPPPAPPAPGYRVLKPVTHANLAVYLIEGPQPAKGHRYLTLDEALEQKKVIVHETSDVNELAVENLSGADEVYIQAGDIIKGGKQDRVFETDFIVPPKSGKLPIAAYCVEQGRWSRRGSETPDRFSSSKTALASRELKLAAKHRKEQGEVWQKVSDVQEKLAAAVAAPVRAEQSASSLQLTLENDNVEKAADEYVRTFASAASKNPRVVGYAFAINGKMNSADVYGSHDLFVKLWPKLLQAMAVEAVSERSAAQPPAVPSVADVDEFLAKGDDAGGEETVSPRMKMVKKENARNVVFETRDTKADAMVHRNYLARE